MILNKLLGPRFVDGRGLFQPIKLVGRTKYAYLHWDSCEHDDWPEGYSVEVLEKTVEKYWRRVL